MRSSSSVMAAAAVDLVGVELLGAQVAEVLVHPVRARRRRSPGRATTACAVISWRQDSDVFQSSRRSWSSSSMPVGTVDSSQRTAGGVQASWYSQVYSSKSWISSTTSGSRSPSRVGLPQPGEDLVRRVVGVDLVAEQQQDVRPLVARGVVDHPRGQRDQCVGAELLEVLVVERRRAAAAAERQAVRRVGVGRADDARRERGVGGRPHVVPVELDRYSWPSWAGGPRGGRARSGARARSTCRRAARAVLARPRATSTRHGRSVSNQIVARRSSTYRSSGPSTKPCAASPWFVEPLWFLEPSSDVLSADTEKWPSQSLHPRNAAPASGRARRI